MDTHQQRNHQQQQQHHHPHYTQHTTSSSTSSSASPAINKKFVHSHTTNNPSAEQKRSKFQRSGGSKQHTGSWCSLANSSGGGVGIGGGVGVGGGPNSSSSPSLTGGGGGGSGSIHSSANGGSPCHSASSSRTSSQAKNSIISSKSISSNKSQQSISSIVASSLLAEVADVISEDERPILPGVPVRAANLPALVHVCVRAFGKKNFFFWKLLLHLFISYTNKHSLFRMITVIYFEISDFFYKKFYFTDIDLSPFIFSIFSH